MEVIIYRFQNKNRVGPYYYIGPANDFFDDCRHILPDRETICKLKEKFDHYDLFFGFKCRESARDWFDKKERKILKEAGFRCHAIKIQASDILYDDGYQIVFKSNLNLALLY